MPAPASSTNEAAICVTANSRSRRLVPPVMRTLPLDEAEAVGASGRGQPRHERQQHRRDQRQRRRRPTAGWRRPSGRARAPRSATRSAPARATIGRAISTPSTAPAPHSSRLSASSVRRSAPVLAPSAARIASSPSRRTDARQDQVGDVRAGDDEDQRRRGQQHQQHGARRRGDLVAQPHRVDAEVGLRRIGLGMRLDHRAVHGRAARRAACSRSAPGASRPNSSVMRCTRPVTIVADEVVRAGDDVGDDLGLGRIRHRRLEHADDRRRPRAEPHGLAEHRRVAARAPSSRSGASAPRRRRRSGRRRACRAAGPSTGRRPMTSKYEPPTTPARTTRGSPRPTIVKPMVEKSPKAVSVLTRARRSCNLRHRERGVLGADAGRALADVDQAVLVAVDQRPQQHAAHHAEDRGVGADAERQGQDDGDRQPLDLAERARGDAQVGRQALPGNAHVSPSRP